MKWGKVVDYGTVTGRRNLITARIWKGVAHRFKYQHYQNSSQYWSHMAIDLNVKATNWATPRSVGIRSTKVYGSVFLVAQIRYVVQVLHCARTNIQHFAVCSLHFLESQLENNEERQLVPPSERWLYQYFTPLPSADNAYIRLSARSVKPVYTSHNSDKTYTFSAAILTKQKAQ